MVRLDNTRDTAYQCFRAFWPDLRLAWLTMEKKGWTQTFLSFVLRFFLTDIFRLTASWSRGRIVSEHRGAPQHRSRTVGHECVNKSSRGPIRLDFLMWLLRRIHCAELSVLPGREPETLAVQTVGSSGWIPSARVAQGSVCWFGLCCQEPKWVLQSHFQLFSCLSTK